MIRHKITLGDPQDETKIIRELLERYRGTTPNARSAEQLRQEIWRRIERLPEGVMKAHLTRKLFE